MKKAKKKKPRTKLSKREAREADMLELLGRLRFMLSMVLLKEDGEVKFSDEDVKELSPMAAKVCDVTTRSGEDGSVFLGVVFEDER